MMRSRVDPAAFAAILPALWAAHNLGDHVVQTDHQAMNKATSWRAMAGHVVGYQVTQAAVVSLVRALTGVRLSGAALLAGSLVSGATHAVIDRRWPVAKILRLTRSPGFAEMRTPIFGMYQADQALHHACLFISALIMASRVSGSS